MNIYFLMLLIMTLLLYKGIISSLFYSPKKIKIISIIALFLMAFRYVALIILCIIQNQNYLYLLKPLVFTNVLSIAMCAITSIFIFARNNKIKLKKILFVSTIILGMYLLYINKVTANINISEVYGYTIKLNREEYYYGIILIINSIFIIKGIKLFKETYSNKLGSLLIIISSCSNLITTLLATINADFAWIVLGDIFWVITLNYALVKFKR